jgi:hypothetical protein
LEEEFLSAELVISIKKIKELICLYQQRMCITLIKFSNYLAKKYFNKSQQMYRISENIDVFDSLCEKFNFNKNKTYLPPDFNLLNDYDKELVFSYIIGLIDGDGSITKLNKRKDCNLRIHLHNSWLDNLIYIENFLYNYFNIEKNKTFSKTGNDGHAKMTISNNSVLRKIKEEVLRLELPILSRKWNLIE